MVDLAVGSEHEDLVDGRGGDIKPEHRACGCVGRTDGERVPIEQLELAVERVQQETRQLVLLACVRARGRRGRRLIRVHQWQGGRRRARRQVRVELEALEYPKRANSGSWLLEHVKWPLELRRERLGAGCKLVDEKRAARRSAVEARENVLRDGLVIRTGLLHRVVEITTQQQNQETTGPHAVRRESYHINLLDLHYHELSYAKFCRQSHRNHLRESSLVRMAMYAASLLDPDLLFVGLLPL